MLSLADLAKYDRIRSDSLPEDKLRELVDQGILVPDPGDPRYYIVVKSNLPARARKSVDKIILEALKTKCMSPGELAEATGLPGEVVEEVVGKLILAGKVHRRGGRICRGSTRITRRRGYGRTIVIEV